MPTDGRRTLANAGATERGHQVRTSPTCSWPAMLCACTLGGPGPGGWPAARMSSRAALPIYSYHWRQMPALPRHRRDGRRCKRCVAGGLSAPRTFWSHQSLPVAPPAAGGYFPPALMGCECLWLLAVCTRCTPATQICCKWILGSSRPITSCCTWPLPALSLHRQVGRRRGVHAPWAVQVLEGGARPICHRARHARSTAITGGRCRRCQGTGGMVDGANVTVLAVATCV